MKPKRIYFRNTPLFGEPLHYRAGVCLGFSVLISGLSVNAGDLLRGGRTTPNVAGAPAATGALGGATPATTAAARANAQDMLARTSHTLNAMRVMQAAARASALQGANNLGSVSVPLPNVPNGLTDGGLQVAPLVAVPLNPGKFTNTWAGAKPPVADPADSTQVTVKQTAQQALLYWQTFNVGKETTLTFDQSDGGANKSQWIAFNKISDPKGNPTQILGSIKADGQVYIINQNGIIFGGSSQVNAHTLTASSLPINDNLVARGLLNNPDSQFLFSALPLPSGISTDAFTPAAPLPLNGDGRTGDVIVQAGAQLSSPTTADHVGGRIALIGANVINQGTIATPDGQTILAAGLQVAFNAHDTSDASLRGIDVYVGAVADPASTLAPYAGTASNQGVMSIPRANVTIAGKTVNQLGVIDGSTSVSLNGRIDLLAEYNAVTNPGFDITNSSTGVPYVLTATGLVDLGPGSVTRILPEWDSTDQVIGTQLTLPSQIKIEGKVIHFESQSCAFAPNAKVTVTSGLWDYNASVSTPRSSFVSSGGQIYLDADSTINVAGSTDVAANVSDNIIAVQLRGAELADSPVLRDGALRGATLYVDASATGVYDSALWAGTPLAGKTWVGTPLANVAGYVGLIQRSVGQLTTAGGSVNLTSGGSVVVNDGATIDVSGGWTNYQGGYVKTSYVLAGNNLIDASKAYPDMTYNGVFTGSSSTTNTKWGVTHSFQQKLAPGGLHYQLGYTLGAAAGALTITTPAAVLDGNFSGSTTAGERQQATIPLPASFTLALQSQQLLAPYYPSYSPTPPVIVLQKDTTQTAADAFALDANGDPKPLRADRLGKVLLSTGLFGPGGFGSLTVYNPDGNIVVPAGETLASGAGGSIRLTGANVKVEGTIRATGGGISLTSYNISPSIVWDLNNSSGASTPLPSIDRGTITLGASAMLDTAGLQVDDRVDSSAPLSLPLITAGGSITLSGYNVNLAKGGIIDASGGVAISPKGAIAYGKGGSISISSGQDPGISSVLGGHLQLESTMSAYSGGIGGSLNLLAPAIALGNIIPSATDVLALDAGFFSKGGFNSFSLTGIGLASDSITTPGMSIAAETIIQPVVSSWIASPAVIAQGQPGLSQFVKEPGVRTPVSLSLSSKGAKDIFTSNLLVRGDTIVGADSIIRVEPGGILSLKGDTVTLAGSLFAPGGTITVTGGKSYPSLNSTPSDAYITVDLLPKSVLSTAGAELLVPDSYGRRIGKILAGGTVTVSGNIAAEAGSEINVSGSSGYLDLALGALGLSTHDSFNSNSPLGLATQRTLVASNGGAIVLSGQQELFCDATLLGGAGGSNALGGSVTISSGRFYNGVPPTSTDITLQVAQNNSTIPVPFHPAGQSGVGLVITDDQGATITEQGYLAANTFLTSGCDSLTLTGNISFHGPVNLRAASSLTIASGGVLSADSAVNLTASHVVIGTPFAGPLSPLDPQNPFAPDNIKPTTGKGTLTVNADLIDIGTLSLQSIASAGFIASNGDIRGDGTLGIQGDILLRAGQIYPTTDCAFQIFAYDSGSGSSLHHGSVTIEADGSRQLPLSAVGRLGIYASTITQGGVLRAPFGSITLGWNGAGTSPVDNVVGSTLPVPVTTSITLESGSITSVSAVDPVTGEALTIPYGLVYNGNSWVTPAGFDITSGGLLAKGISLSAGSVSTMAGSKIDISGGGDLYAYNWVQGLGGSTDILSSNTSFAVIPGYTADFAPVAPFHASTSSDPLGGVAGYVNSSLAAGEKIYLQANGGLQAGYYTLLPARYALLPGSYLVTPVSGAASVPVTEVDGSTLVSGYRFNDLNHAVTPQALFTSFNVVSSSVLALRAQYDVFNANTFLQQGSSTAGLATPRLPIDAAQLTLAASTSMMIHGSVLSSAPTGGRGGQVDLSSPLDILIAAPGAASQTGVLVLDASELSAFGAQSLLIGGMRQTTATGTTVDVATNLITVDNAGTPLSGPDVILVAKQGINLTSNADLESRGTLTGSADKLLIGNSATTSSGDGVLVRVSSDSGASLQRAGLSNSVVPLLTLAGGAKISGSGVIIDSSARTTLNPSASISAVTASINTGLISIQLDNPGSLISGSVLGNGLVLSGTALQNLEASAQNISLTSYSSIDIYGSGQIGEKSTDGTPLANSISLHTGEIRGFNTAANNVTVSAKTITLDNINSSSGLGIVTSGTGTLEFNASNIQIGQNALSLDQYASVVLQSSGGVLAKGTGTFSSSGALTVITPLITTAKGVSSSWMAAGGMDLQNSPSGSLATVTPGLSGTLNLQGAGLIAASNVTAPGGNISLHSTSGDLQISGTIDAGGYAQTFGTAVKYVNGGTISLVADSGKVHVLTGGTLRVAADSEGGDAGKLTVSAVHGSMLLDGTLSGMGGSGGAGGIFTLDVLNLTSTASLNAALDLSSFTMSRSIRIRDGNVLVDGTATTQAFSLAADHGSITVTGTINAAGITGGSISLLANGSVTLKGGSKLDVSGSQFDHAGKGGTIDLEAGAEQNGVASNGAVDIQTGSALNLSIAANSATSEAAGQFSGTLHIRAPQNSPGTDLLVNPINGTITGASKIEVEGYKIYDLTDYGGLITSPVQSSITNDATGFLGPVGTTTAAYQTMADRLLKNNSGLLAKLLIMPGVEIINRAAPTSVNFNLSAVNGAISLPSSGGTITFPSGTPGNDKIKTSVAGTVTTASGSRQIIAANTPTLLAPGSSVTLTFAGSISFASGSGGAIPVSLQPNTTYTTSTTGTTGIISTEGSMVSLNTAASSSIALTAGTRITLPSGTAGNNKIKSSVAGSIISPTGIVTILTANTLTTTAIAAGSTIILPTAGTITFASGTGGAIQVALASGSITPAGPSTVTPSSGNLVLGSTSTTNTSDWNLSNTRFGPLGTSGMLTLRAAGNLVFYNALSDGFISSSYTSALEMPNPLLFANAQSWSYRLTAGADLSAADFRNMQSLASLSAGSGSLLLGKNGGFLTATGGMTAKPSTVVPNLFQVIRTGSGDITINAGRDVQLLNPFATIYSAGTLITDPSLNKTFQSPIPSFANYSAASGALGSVPQTFAYPVQYAIAGGNVAVSAQHDITHLTLDKNGNLVADSERQMPVNWLYRRGYVDSSSGLFGTSNYGEIASTTWWVDYSNFFEGVGALGGGNVMLHAGNDVSNVDAVAPTNARMPSGAPSANALVENGGGDVNVIAGHNIDAGVYYVERGKGILTAGNAITTNDTRSPSMTYFSTPSDVLDTKTLLPTTLFLGKGSFDITSGGDMLLGPMVNAFLLPQGYNNTYWYKSYFSTYSSSDSVNASSLGGSITIRENVTLPSSGASVPGTVPVLQAWFQRELLLTQSPASVSYLQPWLRLTETQVAPFTTAFSLLPPTLRATAYSGDINLTGNLTLSPSPNGTLDLLANGAVNGLQNNGKIKLNGTSVSVWGSSTINLSDADPSLLPSVSSPISYQPTGITKAYVTGTDFLTAFDSLFKETGSTNGNLQTKQALHDQGILHAADTQPLRIYAGTGDISDLTLYSAKPVEITAAQDIRDIALYIQNTSPSSLSVVSAGRDIIAYDANSPLLVTSRSSGNALYGNAQSGDIQISGPGTLEVLTGRNLDLGIGAGNSNGTGTGITSIGNARNPYLDFGGADIIAMAGIGATSSLGTSSADFPAFIAKYVKAENGTAFLQELGYSQSEFDSLASAMQDQIAMQIFYLVLRDAGRDHNNADKPGYKNYTSGTDAIATLFPGSKWKGNINTESRDIRTKNGGDISLLAPGGGLTLATTTIGNPLAPPGIITEAGGNISIFTEKNVSLGISRIFTLRGGNEIIWSSLGNIAAGSSSKTVQSAPPTRVLIDPQSANIITDLAGLATGGGIGVLASVAGVKPGSVDLIAPVGTIDAGDAGIRVSGNLNISAAVVTNSGNISAGGTSTGAAPSAPSSPSVSSMSAASTTAGASAATVENASKQESATPPPVAEEPLSFISVEVIGYGGGDGGENGDGKEDKQEDDHSNTDNSQ
ncbi:MAG: filamentous hemagglutinin family protein [Verrucomicrobiota bacterium]